MRDAFISHAWENKEGVAIPLVAALEDRGISCWLDEYELRVGDSLRQNIERGLIDSRFGVVLLSRAFFADGKYWTGAELEGLFQKEVGGTRVILPVWVDLSHDEVRQHSPILAGRVAARWTDGLETVADKLAHAIQGGSNVGGVPTGTPTSNLFLTAEDHGACFLLATEFEHNGERIRVAVTPRNSAERAFLADLRSGRPAAQLAYQDTAHSGRLAAVRQRSTAAGETYELELEIHDDRSTPMESSYNGISADRIAELRARFILLGSADDQPEFQTEPSGMLRSFVDGAISGGDRAVPVPLAQLREEAPSDSEFLARVRLFAVDQLVLSRVVEHVLRLDVEVVGTEIRFGFEGRRHRRYSNEAPAAISVRGSRRI